MLTWTRQMERGGHANRCLIGPSGRRSAVSLLSDSKKQKWKESEICRISFSCHSARISLRHFSSHHRCRPALLPQIEGVFSCQHLLVLNPQITTVSCLWPSHKHTDAAGNQHCVFVLCRYHLLGSHEMISIRFLQLKKIQNMSVILSEKTFHQCRCT